MELTAEQMVQLVEDLNNGFLNQHIITIAANPPDMEEFCRQVEDVLKYYEQCMLDKNTPTLDISIHQLIFTNKLHI